MLRWVLDSLLAVLLVGVQAGVVAATLFVAGLKRWAGKGGDPPRGFRYRVNAVLLAVPCSAGAAAFGLHRVGLKVSVVAEAVIVGLAVLVLAAELCVVVCRVVLRLLPRPGRRPRASPPPLPPLPPGAIVVRRPVITVYEEPPPGTAAGEPDRRNPDRGPQ